MKIFYTTPEYEHWCSENNTVGWRIKYYKGLGTSSAKEAKEYFSNLQRNRLHFEPLSDESGQLIDMCFNKKRASDRKQWIGAYEQGTHMDFTVQEMSYSDFVNKEYIIMAVQSNLRGIPHVLDGLKPSTRKILFACLKRGLRQEIKVAQLAGYTSEHAAYHHGEASLNGAIVGMAQEYVGSNNISLLRANGQFGTRLLGGKDAASPRYIFTQLSEITDKIFHPDDGPLYTPLKDDGQDIEPTCYLPVIPMLLVNGANGIGTGWSSQVPSHNPVDVIHAIRDILEGRPCPTLKPWFRGFEGRVEPVPDSTKWSVFGVWSWRDATVLQIVELPVGTWTNAYKEYLERGLEGLRPFKKDSIKDVKSNYTDTTIHFTIKFSVEAAAKYRADEELLVKDFKLKATVDTGNMHAFDRHGAMTKYNRVQDIMAEFYSARLTLYGARKATQMAELVQKLEKETNKIRFLNLIVNGHLTFRGKIKSTLLSELQQLQFPPESHEYLLGMTMWNMTADKINTLERDKITTEQYIAHLRHTSTKAMWLHDLNEIEKVLQKKKKTHAS